MSLDDSLSIASQIVTALAAAHERGIIHRDLKPANIILKGAGSPTHSASGVADVTAKVLDFGLAKALAPDAASGASGVPWDPAQSPTMTSPAMTEMGLILGTAAYMAPEQARGRPVDKRADIWAFGCVLFEMLTGRRAFPGESVTDTLASILRADPEWSALPATTPIPIRRLLRRCLAKDPARRLSDINDAQLEIDDALTPADPSTESTPHTRPVSRSLAPWLVAAAVGLVVLALAAVAVMHFRESPPALLTHRLDITPPDGTVFSDAFGATPSVSPDGRSVAFIARRVSGGPRTIWVRSLDDGNARELAGTEEGGMPFWSPDSRSIAFFTSNQLKRVDAAGGPVNRICTVQIVGGGVWTSDGTIVLGGSAGLTRVPASGGEPQALTKVAAGEVAHVLPSFLPDGRRFIFNTIPSSKIVMASLDDPGTVTEITTKPAAYYASGFLFYTEEGRLMAQPFDTARGVLTGDPVALADGLPGYVMPPAATVLVFQTGASPTFGVPVWVGRDGREGERVAGIESVRNPRLSPDGQRLAMVIDGDLWVSDLRGRPAIRLTFDGKTVPKYSPLWTGDGGRLIYEGVGLSSVAADGSEGTPTRVSPPQGHFHPYAYTAAGVIAAQLDSPISGDIVLL